MLSFEMGGVIEKLEYKEAELLELRASLNKKVNIMEILDNFDEIEKLIKETRSDENSIKREENVDFIIVDGEKVPIKNIHVNY